MGTSIYPLLPDHEALLALEPEELAGVVLQFLNLLTEGDSGQLNRYSFSLPHRVQAYPQKHHAGISEALMEAWVWLEREGLLAPRPGAQGEWVFITRRGRKLTTPADLESYRRTQARHDGRPSAPGTCRRTHSGDRQHLRRLS